MRMMSSAGSRDSSPSAPALVFARTCSRRVRMRPLRGVRWRGAASSSGRRARRACRARWIGHRVFAADRIAPEEYDAAMRGGAEADAACGETRSLAEARRLLGFERTGCDAVGVARRRHRPPAGVWRDWGSQRRLSAAVGTRAGLSRQIGPAKGEDGRSRRRTGPGHPHHAGNWLRSGQPRELPDQSRGRRALSQFVEGRSRTTRWRPEAARAPTRTVRGQVHRRAKRARGVRHQGAGGRARSGDLSRVSSRCRRVAASVALASAARTSASSAFNSPR